MHIQHCSNNVHVYTCDLLGHGRSFQRLPLKVSHGIRHAHLPYHPTPHPTPLHTLTDIPHHHITQLCQAGIQVGEGEGEGEGEGDRERKEGGKDEFGLNSG